MKEFRFWKYMMALALIGTLGIANSQAQTNVTEIFTVTLKGKLTPSGATVGNADLSGNTNALALMETGVGILIGEFTVPSAGVTNVSVAYLQEASHVTTVAGKKSVNVLTGLPGPASNAVFLVDLSATGSGFNSKFEGIWIDDSNAVSGSIASIKPKK
jgi:hypothetical protein